MMVDYDHRYLVTSCIYQVTNNSPPDVFLVSTDGHLVGTHRIVLRLFSSVFSNLVVTHPYNLTHISVPASGSVLRLFITMLTRGFTMAQDKEELKYVGDVADIMGLGDVDVKVDLQGSVKAELNEPVYESSESFDFGDNGTEPKTGLPLLLGEWLETNKYKKTRKEKHSFECNKCVQKFNMKCDLKKHKKVDHGESFKPIKQSFKCDKCTQRFFMKWDLRKHKEADHGESFKPIGRPKKAPEDTQRGQKFLKKEKNRKRREEKAKQREEKKRLWLQGLCKGPDGKIVTFREVGKFGSMNINFSQGNQVCSFCGKGFNKKKALMIHEQKHKGENLNMV